MCSFTLHGFLLTSVFHFIESRLDGGESFEAKLESDEAAFRKEFGAAFSSGIEFSKYADIPVEVIKKDSRLFYALATSVCLGSMCIVDVIVELSDGSHMFIC